MKILVIGSGGREHALGWKLRQSPRVTEIFFAPGNGGTGLIGTNVNIPAINIDELSKFAQREGIDLTIVGPEDPLIMGIVDLFRNAGLRIFGPTQKAAQLEASKAFAKELMIAGNIPTANYRSFRDYSKALSYVRSCCGAKLYIKAVCPAFRDEHLDSLIWHSVVEPTFRTLRCETGESYTGMLFPGLMMIPEDGPKVLEFNCRFGDPETQVLMMCLQSDLLEILLGSIDGTLAEVTPVWKPGYAVCVVLASGGYPGEYIKGYAITGAEDAGKIHNSDIQVFHAGTKSTGGTLVTSGGRVLGSQHMHRLWKWRSRRPTKGLIVFTSTESPFATTLAKHYAPLTSAVQ